MRARILLVDDYHDALDMWEGYLRARGYDVVTADDGLSGMQLAIDLCPDLIVLDLDLPGITGFEAAERLRALPTTAHIPLIAATGYSAGRQLDRARLSGFDVILLKPCEPSVLAGEIQRLLTSGHG